MMTIDRQRYSIFQRAGNLIHTQCGAHRRTCELQPSRDREGADFFSDAQSSSLLDPFRRSGPANGFRLVRIACAAVLSGVWFATPLPVDAQDETEPAKAPPVRVETVRPRRETVRQPLRLPATLEPDEQVDLYAKVSGYVARITVDIGDAVHKGDVLVELDVPEMADELARARARLRAQQARVQALQAQALQAERRLDTARATVERFRAERELSTINLRRKQELQEAQAIPQQELDEARIAAAIADARLHIAEAEVAGAEANRQAVQAEIDVARAEVEVRRADVDRLQTLMKYARVLAPFDGVITERVVDHGAFVRSAAEGAATRLLRIARVDRLRLVMDVPERDAFFVRRGTRVSAKVPALDDLAIETSVSRTAVAMDPGTRTMRAEADLDNAKGRLAPGLYADALVDLTVDPQAMVIPSKAIRTAGKQTVVFVVEGGVVRSLPVRIGYDDGIRAEIVEGLTGSEQVIVAAGAPVLPGARVVAAAPGS